MTTSPGDGPLAAEPDPAETTYEIPTECQAVIPADSQTLMQNIFQRLTMLQSYADAVIIQDAEINREASTKLAFLTNSRKQLEAKVKELRTPLNQQLKLISMPFNALLDQIKPITATLGKKVVRWQDEVDARAAAALEEERRKQAEALRQQQAEQEEQARLNESELAQQDAEDTALQVQELETKPVEVQATRTATLGGTVGRGRRWTYEVTELKKVPRKYLAIVVKEPKAGLKVGQLESGHKLVMAQVNSGVREIPGLRIFQQSHIAVR
jgi:hypothetical protein